MKERLIAYDIAIVGPSHNYSKTKMIPDKQAIKNAKASEQICCDVANVFKLS